MNPILVSVILMFVALVLGYPMQILANIQTPRVQAFLDRRAILVRGRKIAQVLSEYKDVRSIKNQFSEGTLKMFRTVVAGLSLLPLVIFLGISIVFDPTGQPFRTALTNLIGLWLMFFGSVFVSRQFRDVGDQLRRCLNFTVYQKNVKDQLRKLGGNPEELIKQG